MAEWQPIASAPKDGTRILVRSRYNHTSEGGYVMPGSFRRYGPEDSWRTDGGVLLRPTHWQPLPDPPEASK